MDIKAEIQLVEVKLQEQGEQIQALENQKQRCLQEALRLDGELRCLKRLDAQKNGDNPEATQL